MSVGIHRGTGLDVKRYNFFFLGPRDTRNDLES